MNTNKNSLLFNASSVAIIGSSPLFLLLALHLSSRGKQVTVFSNGDFGGCWNTQSSEYGPIDCACHLLESTRLSNNIILKHTNTLSYIDDSSTPISLSLGARDNLSVSRYHSRLRILLDLVLYSKALVIYIAKCSLNLFVHKKFSVNPFLLSTISFFLRFRLPQLFNYVPLLWPSTNWASFTEDLKASIVKSNIFFYDDKTISKYESTPTSIRLSCPDNSFHDFDLAIAGESFSTDLTVPPLPYPHLIFRSYFSSSNPTIPRYIHFKDSTSIHRLTVLHIKDNMILILVQPRSVSYVIESISNELFRVFNSLHFNNYNGSFPKLISLGFEQQILTYAHSPQSLPSKTGIYDRLVILKSYGDLSKTLSINRSFFYD